MQLIEDTFYKNMDTTVLETVYSPIENTNVRKTIRYDISIYKIVYATHFIDKLISVSGVIIVPNNCKSPMPIVSVQGGTTFLKADAPSISINDENPYLFLAASGYITFLPDYIGYGSSTAYQHPYYDCQHSASCIIDGLKAVENFIAKHNIQSNKHLYLSGYSEGGYITLAALKSLELHNPTNFIIKAVAAACGGFDLFEMLASVTQGGSKSNLQAAYIAYLILAYIETYQWKKSLSHYFVEPYASLIPILFDGNHSKEEINEALGYDLSKLFNPEFYFSLIGTGAMDLKKVLIQNTLANWAPSNKLILLHSTEDDVIPYQNTVSTYNKMIGLGATQTTFVTIPHVNHSDTLKPMLQYVKPLFDELEKSI